MSIIESSPSVLSGTLVFSDTRVPIRNLFDYLVAGDTVKDFLEDFWNNYLKPTFNVKDLTGKILIPEKTIGEQKMLIKACYECKSREVIKKNGRS